MEIEKAPNTKIFINRTQYAYFSGTSYLGIAALPQFHEIVCANIKKWGTSYGSSRNANITLSIYKKAEVFLRNFFNTEDCVTVSSGTLAGVFTLSVLEKIVDSFFYMPKTHPAILPKNAAPVFIDGNVNSQLLSNKKESICIVADAIVSLETQPFTFNFLQSISKQKKIFLLIDESHSLGVLGTNGNGIVATLQVPENIEIIGVSSLGKAFGVNGGVIFGTNKFVNRVKRASLFSGSAPMNPAFLESFLQAQNLYRQQLQKLQNHCAFVFEKLQSLPGIKISKKYPVFFVDDEEIADFLFSKKIVITSFFYPTVQNKKINRIVLNANHTKEELSCIITTLTDYFNK